MFSQKENVKGPLIKQNQIYQISKAHNLFLQKMEWSATFTHLKIWCSESTSDILVIQNLDLKREVFLKIFHNNGQKWKLNPKSSRRISWACDVSWLYICSNDFKYIRLDIFILRSFNVPIHNCKWINH